MSAEPRPRGPELHRTPAQRAMLHAPNAVVRAILRSPAHRLLSGRLLLLTYTGGRSGAEHTIPVAYVRDGDGLLVTVGWPERKVWWRSLRAPGSRVGLVLAGRRCEASAEVRESHDAVTVRLVPRASCCSHLAPPALTGVVHPAAAS